MKAIVLEIKKGEAAVLREDGIVVTTRQACRVGDTIEVPDRVEVRPARRFGRLTRVAAVAVLALVIAGSTFGYMSVSASSYVSVDAGDTSLEFGVNHFGRVISVEGLDEDSAQFAEEIRGEIRHRRFDDAVSCTMERLEDRGSIEGIGADQVIAGVTSQNANQRDALTQSLQNIVPKDGHGPKIYTVDVTVQERDEAREHKQSPGMFAFENRDDWTEEDWEVFFEEMEHSGHPPLGPQGHGPQPPEGVRPPNAPPGNWQGPPMGPPPGN